MESQEKKIEKKLYQRFLKESNVHRYENLFLMHNDVMCEIIYDDLQTYVYNSTTYEYKCLWYKFIQTFSANKMVINLFIKFLKKENLLTNYRYNILSYSTYKWQNRKINFSELIGRAFNWDSTPEGRLFWNNANIRWYKFFYEKLIKNYK